MKFKDLVKMTLIMALLLYGVIFFFERKMDKMQEDFNRQNKKIDNEFKILSDGVSARSEVQVVAQPGLFDKIFNTALNKQYKDIQKMIPDAIKEEMKNLKVDNTTQVYNKSSFLIEGDSVMFYNKEGVITKIAKIEPVNGDSSLLIIHPQEIELTTVQAYPDPNDPTQVKLFVSGYNKTTGDSLRCLNSLTYVIDKTKKWEFNFKPYVGVNYDLGSKGVVARAGLDPIIYNNKKFRLNLAGIEVRQNLKNQNSFVDLKIIQLQLK